MQDLTKELQGKKALVTGGSRGIGAAIAQRLLDAGATVVVSARSKTSDTPVNAIFIKGDISTNEGARALARETVGRLGGLDILINNAGAARTLLPGTAAIPDEEWQDAISINYLSAVRMTAALMPFLQQSAAAAIVNISAGGAGPFPAPLLHYGAAKAALNAWSLGLAAELAPAKIRVNVVTPGMVDTPGGNDVRKTITDAMGIPPEALFKTVPLGRIGRPDEIAEMVALLVSPRGEWMTGHNYFVDGGAVALGK
ncbi:SDR family oxidoreductase [Chitinophaga agrisoli]|uniref:SDR family oxidoreductase n=1 Tax=Chitinophaga agrisoli TaxID=2607653 RepID=A0A5B2VXP6_9BACT|nr:oxidoreductase [Chitinophaga agrisoli]KAA2243388.1 SDR family oxidoreductase [Chitinophaga agrisoli]